MEEGTIRMSALPLQVGHEAAPQLSLRNKTDDRRASKTLPGPQWCAAGKEAAHIAHFAAVDGERVLDSNKNRPGDDG